MKPSTILSTLGFLTGVAALAITLQQTSSIEERVNTKVAEELVVLEKKVEERVKSEFLSEEKIQLAVDESLRQRELKMVKKFFPYFQRMFATSGEEGLENYTAEKVDTLEELVRPLIQMIKNLS